LHPRRFLNLGIKKITLPKKETYTEILSIFHEPVDANFHSFPIYNFKKETVCKLFVVLQL
jgi:hypothetical protein